MAVAVKSLLCEAIRNFVAGRHGQLLRHVGVAEALGPDQVLVRDDANHDPGKPAVGDLALHPGREQPLGAEDVGIGGSGRGLGVDGRYDKHGDAAGSGEAHGTVNSSGRFR